MAKLKSKEKDVQNAILEWLTWQKPHLKLHFYRNNTGGFKDARGHFYRFGALGSPDIVVIKDGRYIGIECKASNGKQSEHQFKFQQDLEDAGGLYILAHTLDDVIRIICEQ